MNDEFARRLEQAVTSAREERGRARIASAALPMFPGLAGVTFGSKPPLAIAGPRPLEPQQVPSEPASASVYPFQVIDASNEVDGAQVRVRAGEVDDFFSSYLPDGMVDDDDPPFILAVGENGHAYLKVIADTGTSSGTYGQIISCEVHFAATVPSNDFAGGLFYRDIASVGFDAGPPSSVTSIIQWAGGSFGWELSGGTGRFWSLGPP